MGDATPSPLYEKKDDEISLIDLLAVLWHYKQLIIIITAAAFLIPFLTALISKFMPSQAALWPRTYSSETQIRFIDTNLSDPNVILNKHFYDRLIQNNIIKEGLELKEGEYEKNRRTVAGHISVSYDKAINIATLYFTAPNPELAYAGAQAATDAFLTEFKNWDITSLETMLLTQEISMNIALERLTQEQQQIRSSTTGTDALILANGIHQLENIHKEIALRTFETQARIENWNRAVVFIAPEIPLTSSGMSRMLICLIAAFASFFFSVFLAFCLNAVNSLRHDPEVVRKFTNTKKAVPV